MKVKYRVYVECRTTQMGQIEVEAESAEAAIEEAYAYLEDGDDCVDNIDYGDSDGWNVENGIEDVERVQSIHSPCAQPINAATGYKGREVLLT